VRIPHPWRKQTLLLVCLPYCLFIYLLVSSLHPREGM
jgi:hypothetical protein